MKIVRPLVLPLSAVAMVGNVSSADSFVNVEEWVDGGCCTLRASAGVHSGRAGFLSPPFNPTHLHLAPFHISSPR
jgi:hypothetical protein